MGRKMKKLTRAGAGALAGVMIFGLAAPLAPLSVEAAGEIENLALNKTATASEQETDSYSAAKAVDGVVNRDAAKPQSRWATNTHSNQEAQWLKVDLGEKRHFGHLFLHGKEEILQVIKFRSPIREKIMMIQNGRRFMRKKPGIKSPELMKISVWTNRKKQGMFACT